MTMATRTNKARMMERMVTSRMPMSAFEGCNIRPIGSVPMADEIELVWSSLDYTRYENIGLD